MPSLLLYALLFIVNSYIATAAETLKIFIDEVPDYALLSTCAEAQLSTIVRDMAYGCGDDSLTTSYICFCYLSSASVTSQIRKHVESACSEQPAQNASMALSVFDSYCHIGHLEQPSSTVTSVTAPPTSSATASPGSTPLGTPPPTNTPASPSSSDDNTNVAAIAAGVTVPVVGLSVALAGFLIYHRKQKAKKAAAAELEARNTSENLFEVESKTFHEMNPDPQSPVVASPVEMGPGVNERGGL